MALSFREPHELTNHRNRNVETHFDHRDLVPHYGLPHDLRGQRALDIGSGDGFWAFELERRGAEVTSYDIESFRDVDLPPALKGKIIAVDPKYEFVVLNIGLDDGVLARGEMLVNRSGKLVAKVRILTAEPHRSVANVLPDWKQGEIMEGDIVLVGL